MSSPIRILGTWVVRIGIVLLCLVLIDVAILAFPYPFFSHSQRYNEFTVYSTGPIPEDFERIIGDVRQRARGMEYGRPGSGGRVFICGEDRLYSLFAFLTRKSSNSMAIGLKVFKTIFIRDSRIKRIAANESGKIYHSRFEGNYAGIIAHEIAHFTMIDELGFRKALAMPVWKSEGYADYQANRASIRSDEDYRLLDRISLLEDDAWWGYRTSIARKLFEWQVIVEYLSEIEGYGLRELIAESVTEAGSRERMLGWYGKQLR
jgi:hypothetical protein